MCYNARQMHARSTIRSILCIAAVVALVSDSVRAADEAARVPTPITSADLSRFGDVLRLSDEQRLAAAGLFEEYLDQFEGLRAEMLEIAVQYPRRGGWGSDEEFLKRLSPSVANARALDETFFDRVAPLLTHAQREELGRVRAMRERALYARLDVVARLIGDGVPDLRELLDSLDPPVDVLDPLKPGLDGYELRLTESLRGVFADALRVCTTDQPGAADQLIERVRALRAFNRDSFRTLHQALPEPWKEQFHEGFYLRAYGAAVEAAPLWIAPQIKAALALPTLADAERESLRKILAEAGVAYESALQEVAEMLDRQAIYHAPAGGARGNQEYFDVINATRQRILSRQMEWRQRLLEVLGADRFNQVKDIMVPTAAHPQGRWEARCGIVAFTNWVRPRTESRGVPPWRADPLLAQPITPDEINDDLAALKIEGEQREIGLDLFQQYAQDLETELEPLRHQTIFYSMPNRPGEGEGRDPLTRPKELAALRQKIRAAVEAADESFFAILREVIGIEEDDAGWNRVMRLRQRARLRLDLALRPPKEPNRAAEIDILRIVMRHAGAAFDDRMGNLASEYEAALESLLVARFDLHTTYSFDSLARRDGWRDDGSLEALQRWSAREDELHHSHQAIAALNAAMIGRFAQGLPSLVAADVVDDYNRSAFPDAYKDDACMAGALAAAANVAGLTADQQTRIGELRAEFVVDYEEVRQRMIDGCAAYPPLVPMVGVRFTPDRSAAEEKFEQGFAQAAAERAAVNRRALRGLRLALTPAQLRRIELPQVD